MAATGPASIVAKSRTRTPSKGPAISLLIQSGVRVEPLPLWGRLCFDGRKFRSGQAFSFLGLGAQGLEDSVAGRDDVGTDQIAGARRVAIEGSLHDRSMLLVCAPDIGAADYGEAPIA